MQNTLKVGLIQTCLNVNDAWNFPINNVSEAIGKSKTSPYRISRNEEEKAWYEIKSGFHAFCRHSFKPDIILMPELAVPTGRLHNLVNMARQSGILVIGGLDYRYSADEKQVCNEGVIIIPDSFYTGDNYTHKIFCHYFGKSYPSPVEKENIDNRGDTFTTHPEIWLLKTRRFGQFGISICYDFMDIERAVLYRGRIQHLLVIAYNRDTDFFKNLAISLSRTVFCNVIICNTGYYGSSIAVSPYHDSFRRICYLQEGGNTFSSQIVELPLIDLHTVQQYGNPQASIQQPHCKKKSRVFKDPPPGFKLR